MELRLLIFRMVAENPTWGAPRIHGKLTMLGFDVSERMVFRWMGERREVLSLQKMGGISE